MAGELDRLRGIRARRSREILGQLAALAQKVRAGEGLRPDLSRLPRVIIDLEGGHSYEGVVLDLESCPAGHSVLFANHFRETGADSFALSFLELPEHFQLTICDAQDFLGILRFGEVTRWSNDEAIRSLALKRFIEQTRAQLADTSIALSCADELIVESGTVNNAVRDVLGGIGEYVERTQKDPVGAKALRSIRHLRLAFVASVPLRCARNQEDLRIELDPREGLPEKAALFSALDGLL